MPESRTARFSKTCSPSRFADALRAMLPSCVNLTAFPRRLSNICRSRQPSPISVSGSNSLHRRLENVEPFSLILKAKTFADSLRARAEKTAPILNLELTGFNLGQIQEIVQNRKQSVAGRPNGRQGIHAVRQPIRLA